ncbi:hypothetical protein [Microbacterium sp. PMB16]|uniref:hypothetical protein n=1 Tax=Microbacterium sp. PMB16 TaxID=3120157 RepID=UPI003F4B6141
MNGSETLVRLAAGLLPRARRAERREEWLADLAGAEELGIPRSQVALGALRAALSEGARVRRAAFTPRRALAVVAIGVGVVVVAAPAAAYAVMLVSNARGVVTVESGENGDREVFWRDYPGIPELEPEDVLAGPTLEEGEETGRALLEEIEAALAAEFGLEWAPAPAVNEGQVSFPAQNYYGGASMLRVLNVQSRLSTSVPATWDEKERMLAVIADVAANHGYADLSFDYEAGYMTEADIVESYGGATPEEMVLVSGMLQGPTGQWIMFSMQDLSLDHDGRFAEQFESSEEHGWLGNSISFTYGANGLLPAADRAEFERRLEPYAGLERPEPLES